MATAVIGCLVLIAAVTVYIQQGWGKVVDVVAHDFLTFLELLPKILAGCLIGAFVTMLLPREVVARWIGGESGIIGIIIAAMVGVFLPGGPFAIYPVTAALVGLGADVGAIAAFITAWSLLGYNRALVWELPFMGGDFVLWRVIISIPLPIVAGLFARMLANVMARPDEAE